MLLVGRTCISICISIVSIYFTLSMKDWYMPMLLLVEINNVSFYLHQFTVHDRSMHENPIMEGKCAVLKSGRSFKTTSFNYWKKCLLLILGPLGELRGHVRLREE
jgi:hypothetical protein